MQRSTSLVSTSSTIVMADNNVSDSAKKYAAKSRADNTKRAYETDLRHFTAWCDEQGREALPATPQTVASYIGALADNGYKPATITRRLASISQAHQLAGYESPTKVEGVRTVLKGIRREHTTVQDQAAPVTIDVLRRLVDVLPDDLLGQRDRALLLIGFAGALRRSELVALQVEDVQFVNAGMLITLKRSKTDQEGQGTIKGIAFGTKPTTCPVRALKAWLKASGITEGPIFRPLDRWGKLCKTTEKRPNEQLSDRAVARVVQRTAVAAGVDLGHLSGHSLRAGLITSAAIEGATETEIMRQSGHRSSQMVRKYIRVADVFKGNVSSKVGL